MTNDKTALDEAIKSWEGIRNHVHSQYQKSIDETVRIPIYFEDIQSLDLILNHTRPQPSGDAVEDALDALDRLENDALSGRDGYGDARKDAEIIRNFINTRPQPSGDAVEKQIALEMFDYMIKHSYRIGLDEKAIQTIRAALTQPKADVEVIPEGIDFPDEAWLALGARGNLHQVHTKSKFPCVKYIRADLAAQGVIGVPEGYALVPIEVIKFLNGESKLDGCSFGERPIGADGMFWWRKYLSVAAPKKEGK